MTEIQIPWAPGAAYIHIVCRLGRIVPDGPDIDDSYPDLVTQGGKVKLVCSVDWVRYSETDTRRRWLDLSSSWEYGIRPEDGELFNPETGAVGVGILSGETVGMDPGGFTWRATVTPNKGKSFTVVIPANIENFDLVDAIDTPSVTPQLTSTLTPRVAALEARVDDLRFVRTVNGVVPDSAGNVTVTAAPPAAVAPATPAQAPALERLRALRAFGAGQVRVAVVGDSTGNDSGEWVRLWSKKYGALLPANVRRTYKSWDGSAWRAETVDAAGPPSLLDTFTRTGAVGGTIPDSGGAAWRASGGGWTANGTAATAPASGTILYDVGAKNVALTVKLNVGKPAANVPMRIWVATNTSMTNGVWAVLTLYMSGGITIGLQKTIGGTSTSLAGAVSWAGVTGPGVTGTLKLELSGQAVTLTGTSSGGQETVVTGTLTEGDLTALGTDIAIVKNGADATSDLALDEVSAAVNPAESDAPLLSVWNGSIAGATPAVFDATLRASQFGANPFDIIVLNFGHNGGQTGPQFVTTITDWLAAWATEHPESVPLLMSQNPQKAPATTSAAHAARLAALRGWAAEKRHPYIPVWETFRARADKGDPLVLADGIHPTTPPGSDLTGDYGSVLWADTVLAATS